MNLDIALALRTSLAEDFYFVQIGAYDGRLFDPIFPWVKAYGWHGLLIEPQPRHFDELIANYRGVDGLEFRQVAVSVHNETRPFYTVTEGPGIPAGAGMLASFDKSTLLSHRGSTPELASHIRSEDIECVAINDLLDSIKASHIDLLQIDVEGYDHELIRALDLERFLPSLIHFEHRHLTRTQHDDCVQRLIAHGYAICLEQHDTLACQPSDLPQPPSAQ
jgi:FkbM family methyltransferase